MKHKMLAALLALGLAGSALAGPPRPQPVVSVSCTICVQSTNIVFTGSGFKQGSIVYLVLEGPESSAITVNIGTDGHFSVSFGGLRPYEIGAYTVTAFAGSGKRATPVAATTFSVVK